MKKLVIAEKPSVARSLAAVIGATAKRDGYLEGNGYIVSWCIGHLIKPVAADSYSSSYSKWRIQDLPIIPSPWKYEVIPESKSQFALLKKLLNDPSVTSVICATDAGREGELIFRLVYNQAGSKKPIERLWLSSMEEAAIKEGFLHLRSGEEFENLYHAALSRQSADWLVGINATRLFSCTYGTKLNVGRVMSPTLALVVQREAAISAFKSAPFYSVVLELGSFKAASDRFDIRADAEKLAARCYGKEAVVKTVSIVCKEQNAPALYDLTMLQRDANSKLGYTAQQTLDYAQSLYEKKLITYPRTDSRFLTDDMGNTAKELLFMTASKLGYDVPLNYDTDKLLNSKKVSDHHALLPTLSSRDFDLSSIPSGESAIFSLVCRSLLMAASEPFKYQDTTVTLSCAGSDFTAKGKVVLNSGWKLYESAVQSEDKAEDDGLPLIEEGESYNVVTAVIKEGKTTPPKHYTEDTLLAAMENAGAQETPDEAERKGLGTPATRASIIEKLIKIGFLTREKKKKTTYIISSKDGEALISVLPEALQSPLTTAEWEYELLQIERGVSDPDAFLSKICDMLSTIIDSYVPVKGADVLFPSRHEKLDPIGICPRCASNVFENKKGYCCSNRECNFAIWKDDRFFKASRITVGKRLVTALLKDGKVYIENMYSPKKQKLYDATVILEPGSAGEYVRFRLDFK